MNQADLRKLGTDLRIHASRFIDVSMALQDARRRTLLDHFFAAAYRLALKIKRWRQDD
jgi:hypothetical protein